MFLGVPSEYPVIDKIIDLRPFMISSGCSFFTEYFIKISPGWVLKFLCRSDDSKHVSQQFLNCSRVLLVDSCHEDCKAPNPRDDISDLFMAGPSYFEAWQDNIFWGSGSGFVVSRVLALSSDRSTYSHFAISS